MHAGGRRFEPAWLHHVVPGQVENTVAIKRIFDFVDYSGHAKRRPGDIISEVSRFIGVLVL